MLRSVMAFVGYNLVFGAMIAHVDNAAHVGGLVMGLILGALIARVAPAHDAILRRIGVLVFGAVLLAGGATWLGRSRAYLVHRENGVAHLYAGDPDTAIRELQKAAKQQPNFVPTYEALAQAYVDKHDYDQAAAQLRHALTFDPRDENLYYDLGRVYLSARQPAKAGDSFRQLLRINPNSAEGHAGLGSVLAYQQNNDEALIEFKRAAEIDAFYPGVYYKIGILEAQLHQPEDAIAALLKQRQVLDAPENESLLAELYDAAGMKEQAEAARAKAAEFSEKK
jgi:tetratricopeptide (TPR) repeat protein